MNIEFGVVRWARGEYDSYFCRYILHVDVVAVIPRRFVPTKRSVFVSSETGKDGFQVAPNPHALFEANAAQPRRPQGTHNTLTPHPAINLYNCSSPTTTLKKHLDVTFASLGYGHKSL